METITKKAMPGINKMEAGPRRLVGLKGFMGYCGLGKEYCMRLGREIGARVEIGNRVLYDLKVADAYFDQLHEQTRNG